jgi:hypothetical protein
VTAPKRVHGINWRQHDDTDDDLDALQADPEQVAAAERARIAAWLRRKAMAGLAAGLPDTPTLLGLLAYADAIQADNTQE